MEQLLSIKHIPIKIEVKVTRGELKPKEPEVKAPSVKISKQSNGGVQVAAQPCTIDITAPRYDTYTKSPVSSGSDVTLTYDAIAKMSSGSDDSIALDGDSTKIAARSASSSIEAILNKLPKTKNNSVSYNEGTLSINYSMDNSDGPDIADLSSGFEFIPGSIEFVVSQMPDLEIEYLGDPIYFPRSADPNYKGEVDVIA